MLDHLPESLLASILTLYLSHADLEQALRSMPCVCQAWRRKIFADEAPIWESLLLSCCHRRHTTTSRRQRQRRISLKQAYWQRRTARQEAQLQQKDAWVEQVARRLQKSDCLAWIRRSIHKFSSSDHDCDDDRYDNATSIDNNTQTRSWKLRLIRHASRSLEHRTIVHYAAWNGRCKTLAWLLSEWRENKTNDEPTLLVDDNGATPLLLAAWAGQAAAVRLLVANQHPDAHRMAGVPPLTSSCGGRGPKTPLDWARRKGWNRVVCILLEASSSRSTVVGLSE